MWQRKRCGIRMSLHVLQHCCSAPPLTHRLSSIPQDYIRECRKITAEWWPCHGINKHTYERVREAERSVLVAEFCAREAASAILHGSTAIRAKQTPHAMDGVSRAGVPVEDAQDGAKKGAAS